MATENKVGSKLESLPKEELLKFVKKQAINSKELKKKIEELSEQLNVKHNEVICLEKEKKDWISRGVTAEFEKKEKLVKKDRELELAAKLGKEMLAENDVLQDQIDELKKDRDDTIQSFEDELEKALEEKEVLEKTLSSIHQEFMAAKNEAEQCRAALQTATDIHEKDIKALTIENKELYGKAEDLEHQLNTSTANLKLHKIKEKYEECLKENKSLKELEKQRRAGAYEMESLQAQNNELIQSLQVSEDKNREVDEELQKTKTEKERQMKSLKSAKSKLQKALQAEEEVKKQLSVVTAERDQLLKKKTKKVQKKAVTKTNLSEEKENENENNISTKSLKDQVLATETDNGDFQSNTDNSTEFQSEVLINQRLQNDFESLSFEVDELNATITSLQEENRQQKEENNELTLSKEKLLKQYESLASEKDTIMEQNVLLSGDCKSTKDSFKEKQSTNKEINPLKNKMKRKAKKETNEKYEDIEETKATIVKLEARVNELVNQLQTLNEEKHHQECELEELFKSHDDLQNKYDFECQERQKRESEVHYLEKRIVKLESEKNQNKVTADLEEQIGCLEQQVKESHKECDRYKNEVLIKEQHITQLRSEIEHLNQKQLQSNAANNKEVDSICHEFEQLDQQFCATKKELQLSLQEKAEFEKLSGELQSEKRKFKEVINVLTQKLVECTGEQKNLEYIHQLGENFSGTEESNIIIDMIDSLIMSHGETLSENKSLQSQMKALMSDTECLNKEILNGNEQVVLLTEANSHLQNTLNDLKIKFQEKGEAEALIEKELLFYHGIKSETGCYTDEEFQNYIDSIKVSNFDHEPNTICYEKETQTKDNNEFIDEAKFTEVNEGELLKENYISDEKQNLPSDVSNQLMNSETRSCHESVSKKDIPLAVLEEFEQYKKNYQNVEEELQAALNRIDDLEFQLSAKQEESENIRKSLQENETKNSKYRSFALKAKKEIESYKTSHESERRIMEDKLKHLLKENKVMKDELVQQKTECSKHEEEFEELQKEIKSLKESICTEQECVSKLKGENEELHQKIEEMLIKASTMQNESVTANLEFEKLEQEKALLLEEKLKIEENLQQKTKEVGRLKEQQESLQSTLTNSQKQDTQKLALMNLEIQDYQRTIETLQNKSLGMEKVLNESRGIIDQNKTIQETLNQQISTLSKKKQQFEEKTKKLKSYVIKLKKELEDSENLRIQETSSMEELKQKNDEARIELAEMTSAKNRSIQQLNTTITANKKTTQTLEVNFARVSTDLMTLQNTHAKLQEEYETYKVRAHNVLKQRKNVFDSDVEYSETEWKQLQETTDRLKNKLEETTGKLNLLESEYTELKNEHEGLLGTYDQIVAQIKANELVWKERLESLKKEKKHLLESNEKLKDQNDKLTKKCMKNAEEMEIIEGKYKKEMDILKDERKKHDVEEKLETSTSLTLDLEKQNSVESTKTDNSFTIHKIERQEGEGMDQKELELIDILSNSAPQTPKSPTHVAILEKLLSPTTDIQPQLSSPQTPGSLREELFNFKSALSIAMKKNEHMTALLRESEANAIRLDDQAKVLKEEIRRLERNEQREQALSNLEYLKNVIIKFLKVGQLEREQLIPVLTTMLKLSKEEKQFIMEYSKGERVDNEEQNNSWSSYVYSWTSLS